MKQLFFKSNLLHIRTNEGVFEVSNPEILSKSDCFNLSRLNGIEWPGGVEFETIAPHPECNKARECLQLTNGLNCSQAYDARTRSTSLCAKSYKLVRLLPKEEKKDDQPMSFTESAYKEWEDKPVIIIHDVTSVKGGILHSNKEPIESSEPQENIFDLPKDVVFDLQRIALADDEMSAGFGAGVEYRLIARSILNKHRKPVSAPSESQEEMYNEVRQEYLKHRGRIWTKEEVMLKWIIENYKLITRNP